MFVDPTERQISGLTLYLDQYSIEFCEAFKFFEIRIRAWFPNKREVRKRENLQK